jgi:drug/metabolite transporter (DMT)-like permease
MTTAALLILPLLPFTFQARQVAVASPTALACIAYLALMTSVLSYLLWYYALSKTLPSKVAVFSNLQPVATALAAWLLLGDPLRWELAVGGALVLAGVRLTQTA